MMIAMNDDLMGSCYYSLPPGLFRNNLRHWLGTFSRLLMAQFPSNEGFSNVLLKYCLISMVVAVCIKFPASFTRTTC